MSQKAKINLITKRLQFMKVKITIASQPVMLLTKCKTKTSKVLQMAVIVQ